MLPACVDEALHKVVWRHVGPFWLAHARVHKGVTLCGKYVSRCRASRTSDVAVPVNVPDHGAGQGSERASQTLIHLRRMKKTADANACAVFGTWIAIFPSYGGILMECARPGTDVAWFGRYRAEPGEPGTL